MPPRAKKISCLRIETIKNDTLLVGTYLSSPCMGAPSPTPLMYTWSLFSFFQFHKKNIMSVNKKWSRGVFRHPPSLTESIMKFRNGSFSWERKKARVPQGDMKIKIDACILGKLLLKFIIAEQSCWLGRQFLASGEKPLRNHSPALCCPHSSQFTFGINHHLIVPVDIL